MTYDPDNPPLSDGVIWRPGRERFLERVAEHRAKRQLVLAHGDSISNRKLLTEYDGSCGCFYCLRTFEVSEITDWVNAGEATALCPHCHIDAVLPRTDQPFLKAMHDFWFGRDHRRRP